MKILFNIFVLLKISFTKRVLILSDLHGSPLVNYTKPKLGVDPSFELIDVNFKI
jgi:hypothetical protein